MIRDYTINKKDKIILVGVGRDSTVIKKGLCINGIKDYYLCDKKYTTNREKNEIGYEDITKINNYVCIIASGKYCIEIYETLKDYEIQDEKIFTACSIYMSALDGKEIGLEVVVSRFNYIRGINRLYEKCSGGWRLCNLDVFITEKCSLNCRYCCALIPQYKNPISYDYESIYEGVEYILETNCYFDSISIMGGEPFMNQKTMCEFLLKYKDNIQIATFQIITNGTIIPNDTTIQVLKELKNVYVIFSNYGKLSCNKDKAVQKLLENNIAVAIEETKDIKAENNTLWLDYGEVKKYNRTQEELKKMYDSCYDGRYCYSLLKNKLYICNRIAHGVNLGLIPESLNRTVFDIMYEKENSKNISEFRQKCIDFVYSTDYPQACDYCNRGAGKLGERAEQISRI